MKTFSKTPAPGESSRTIGCPVCGSNSFRLKWKIESSLFVNCRDCGLILQNPQPLRGELAARYDNEYFRYEIENEERFFHLMQLGLEDVAFFRTIAPELPQPKRILDIGCATGRLLKHFRDAGWDTRGAELCRDSVEYGNNRYGVNIFPGDLQAAGFPDAYFSVVHASHLIEHVDDPAGFVAEVFRVLVPGGVFVCVTPSSDGLQARLYGSRWRSAIADHVFLFNKKTLARLLSSSGFRVEQQQTWGGIAVGSVPLFLKKPIDRLAKVLGFGDVVLMLARKP